MASTTPSMGAWTAGSRDRLVQEVTERVETAFSEVVCIARDTLETANQQHELEKTQLRQQLSAYTERIRTLEQELEACRNAAARLAIDLGSQRSEHDRVVGILSSIRSALEPGDPRMSVHPAAPILREEVTADGAIPEVLDPGPTKDENVAVLPQIDRPAPPKASWSEYASQLLEQIESSYNSDVESGERSADVVDHLTEYLRLGRGLYSTRFKDEPEASQEFDRQLSATLDAKAAIPFGRHLGFAWYAITQPTDSEAVA